ncbi:hypothetical protein XENORESO_007195 [Xenotaenia resolanae]|uniref:Uncharacterized protein n=1 Tax=Xenotaenia resolanae TaxID=208358 RepID=A0ABV0WKL5_9TELE
MLLPKDLQMSHKIPKVFLGKRLYCLFELCGIPTTSVILKCVYTLLEGGTGHGPQMSQDPLAFIHSLPLTHIQSCEHSQLFACSHSHTSPLTDVFSLSAAPFPPFFPPLTSPFQATQNGCKHKLSAGIVECLRGLHSLLVLRDRQSSLCLTGPWVLLPGCTVVVSTWLSQFPIRRIRGMGGNA